MFDVAFIGGGPSSMFAAWYMVEHGYKGRILILEGGKSLKYRGKDELLNGIFGAGCFSDSKLVAAQDVGGVIPGLTQEDIDEYSEWVVRTLNRYNYFSEPLEWSLPKPFDTSPTSLEFNIHKTLHIGTDLGQKIYQVIENRISTDPRINIYTDTHVYDVKSIQGGYSICCTPDANAPFYRSCNISLGTNLVFEAKKVVLATGQKSTLPERVMKLFGIKTKSRALQIGIRVEDEINLQYEKIIDANYDFKFVKTYNYDNGCSVRVRTFCCNSGNAHTCAENTSEGFTCFNGHAYKTPDPANHSVNYGIMCEVAGLSGYDTKQEQISLMQNINKYPTWKADNFDANGEVLPKRKLLDGVDFLKEAGYPAEVCASINDFIQELSKLVNLENAKFLYPEVKLSGVVPDINYKTFETSQKDLYMLGDCCISRGIFKGICTAIIFAKNQLVGEQDDI